VRAFSPPTACRLEYGWARLLPKARGRLQNLSGFRDYQNFSGVTASIAPASENMRHIRLFRPAGLRRAAHQETVRILEYRMLANIGKFVEYTSSSSSAQST
jgi:hypothetical protein